MSTITLQTHAQMDLSAPSRLGILIIAVTATAIENMDGEAAASATVMTEADVVKTSIDGGIVNATRSRIQIRGAQIPGGVFLMLVQEDHLNNFAVLIT